MAELTEWHRYRHFTVVSERDQLSGMARHDAYERIVKRQEEDHLISEETIERADDYIAKRSTSVAHGDRDLTLMLAAGQAREGSGHA